MTKNKSKFSDLSLSDAAKKKVALVDQLVRYRLSLDASLLPEKGGVSFLKKDIKRLARICAKGLEREG